MKQVRLADNVNKALEEIAEQRNAATPHRYVSKQEVVSELILKAHKRECKRGS